MLSVGNSLAPGQCTGDLSTAAACIYCKSGLCKLTCQGLELLHMQLALLCTQNMLSASWQRFGRPVQQCLQLTVLLIRTVEEIDVTGGTDMAICHGRLAAASIWQTSCLHR